MLEVHPGGDDHLLLQAHLPYWEGLIHVVERAGRMVGVDGGGPGAWGPLEVTVHAILVQDRARECMATLVRRYGQPLPGLDGGLTHLFPSAEVLAAADLDGIPSLSAEAIRACAAGVVAGDVVLDGSTGTKDVVASLSALPGIGTAVAHEVADRVVWAGAAAG